MSDVNAVSAYDLYGTDKQLEVTGVWIDVGPMKFKVARAGGDNDAFTRYTAKKFRPYQVAIENDSLPKETAKSLLVDIYVETIVKDWQGVFGRDKQEIPYSKDAARQLFMDLPDVLLLVQAEASKLGNFNAQREAAAKN